MQRLNFDGIELIVTSTEKAAETILRNTVSPPEQRTHFHLPNAYTLVLAESDPALRASLSCASGLNFLDGKGVSTCLRILRRIRLFTVLRGPDLFEKVLDQSQGQPIKHFLFGSLPTTLRKLEDEIASRWPSAQVVGTCSPAFHSWSEAEWCAYTTDIRNSGATLLWIGLGTPKQDKLALRLAAQTGITCVTVGAAFAFTASITKPAPRLFQRLSVEWLYRLMSEPRRLWKRYLIGNVHFIYLSLTRGIGLR